MYSKMRWEDAVTGLCVPSEGQAAQSVHFICKAVCGTQLGCKGDCRGPRWMQRVDRRSRDVDQFPSSNHFPKVV